jgi:hypothetical protein
VTRYIDADQCTLEVLWYSCTRWKPMSSFQASRHDSQPGDELNVFGTRTGRTIEVHRGERLPVLPRSCTWRHVPAPEY